jgi:predicted enzyme related to lactoylglutathione lyase
VGSLPENRYPDWVRDGTIIAMTSRFSVLAIDALEPRVVADFWCAVLGWEVTEEDTDGVSIAPRDGTGPAIDLLAVPERKTVKNRLHLDLRADGVTTAEELDRLLALGAERVDIGQGPGVSWVVLADPEGNEFCLLSRTVQEAGA